MMRLGLLRAAIVLVTLGVTFSAPAAPADAAENGAREPSVQPEEPQPEEPQSEEPQSDGQPACTETPEQCGRQAFEAGVAAYQQEHWDEARHAFKKALEYRWHPAIALNLALAEARADRYLQAIAVLDRIRQSPEASPELIEKAELEHRRATEALGHIEIDTQKAPKNIQVSIDGEPLSGQASVAVNPGTHEIRVSGPDRPSVTQQVTVASAERVRLNVTPARELVLSVPGNASDSDSSADDAERRRPAPARSATEDHPPRNARSSLRRLDPLWFYVGAGATAVAAGLTVWSGLDTLSAHDRYEDDFSTLTQAEVNDRVAEGHNLERRTNILIGVTAAATVGTAALGVFFVKWRTPDQTAVSVSPSLGGANVRGTF